MALLLRDVFRAEARGGNRVLVTTMNEMVARQKKVVHIHRETTCSLRMGGARE
jgi:hypothetical protein